METEVNADTETHARHCSSSRCPDLIRTYTKTLDKDKDGTYSWAELLPIVKDFYHNMWDAKRPKVVDEGDDEYDKKPQPQAQDQGTFETGGPSPEASYKVASNQVAPAPLPALPLDWVEVPNPNKTGDHDAVYFWNQKTDETVWIRPTH